MTCHECKSKKSPFPPKVLEIIKESDPVLFHRVDYPASLGDDTTVDVEDLGYKNVLLYFEANKHAYLFSSDGIPTRISVDPYDIEGIVTELENLGAKVDQNYAELEELNEFTHLEVNNLRDITGNLQRNLEQEATNRIEGDSNLQEQIDAIESKSDVVDVVDTYADLQKYATASLGDNDVVKVLQDETHDGAISYYRWDKAAGTWNYIGSVGPYYTKAEANSRFLEANELKTINGESLIGSGNIEIETPDQLFVFETYSQLENLPLSELKGGEIAVVSQDETQNGATAYYRYSAGAPQLRVGIGGTGAQYTDYFSADQDKGILTVRASGATNISWAAPNVSAYDYDNNSPEATLFARYLVKNSGDAFTLEGKLIPDSGWIASSPVAPSYGTYYFSFSRTNTTLTQGTQLEFKAYAGAFTEFPGASGWNLIAVGNAGGEVPERAKNLPQYVVGGAASGSIVSGWSMGANSVTMKLRYTNLETGASDQAAQTSIPMATSSTAGAMSAQDKANLDALVEGGGGGSSVELLSEYNSAPTDTQAYDAGYMNGRLDGNSVQIGSSAVGKSGGTVAIGESAQCSGNNTTAIGYRSYANNGGSIALGREASASQGSIAIGEKSFNSTSNTVSFGDERAALTRRLTNIKAGELDTDAVNLKQMQDYVAEHGGGGGGTLYSEYGDNEDGALTQKFVSEKLNANGVIIGKSADIKGQMYGIAIGSGAVSSSPYAVALGWDAQAGGEGSIALGTYAVSTRDYELSIGNGQSGGRSELRYLANVRDGERDQDAVTVHQLNESVGNITAVLARLSDGAGI